MCKVRVHEEEARLYQGVFMDVSTALQRLGSELSQDTLQGKWSDRRPLNIPGPFYCGDVDNSGPGPAEAPNNVLIDAEGFPFIFRQPTSMFELRQVLLAAQHDPFRAYAADGDQHWSPNLIREWWQQRHEIAALIASWRSEDLQLGDHVYPFEAALDRWMEYLDTEAEQYLRIYAFFLEAGRLPQSEESLPSI
jgi:hypothetical protein